MLKRLALTLGLLVFGAAVAFAAPLNGKITAIDKDQVKVQVVEKLPDWVKAGKNVRFLATKGKIVAVAADVVTITTPKAGTAKVGQAVTLEKPRPGVSGC